MKTRHTSIRLTLLLLFALTSCEKTHVEKKESKLYSIEGHVQKGPFIVGSNVTVSELNDQLYPTGRVFFSTILDDAGYFELPGVVLESPYIQIKAEGFYFSEVSGGIDYGAKLTLYSLADITDNTTINVNILTRLEKERVEYLVQHENKGFAEAKHQALNEVLAVFNLENDQLGNSSDLDIFGEAAGHATLLAVSSIIEAAGDFAGRLELITKFQKDLEDGILDSEVIQRILINTAAYRVNPEVIMTNLNSNFLDKNFSNITFALNQFLENSAYANYFKNIFPEFPPGTINLLQDTSIHEIDPTKNYVLAFSIPIADIGLKNSLTLEHYFKTGKGNVSSTFTNWTYDNLQSCSDPNDTVCWNYLGQAFFDASTAEVIIPLTFTGHGEFFYQIYLSAENERYLWAMNTNGKARFITW